MTGERTLKDELCKFIMDYVLQWQQDQTGDAITAEIAVTACVLRNEPLSVPEAMSWMRRHSQKSLHTPNKTPSGGSNQRRLPWASCRSDASMIAQDGFGDEPVLKTIDPTK